MCLHGSTEATPILDGLIHKPHPKLEERVFIHRLGEYTRHHIIRRQMSLTVTSSITLTSRRITLQHTVITKR